MQDIYINVCKRSILLNHVKMSSDDNLSRQMYSDTKMNIKHLLENKKTVDSKIYINQLILINVEVGMPRRKSAALDMLKFIMDLKVIDKKLFKEFTNLLNNVKLDNSVRLMIKTGLAELIGDSCGDPQKFRRIFELWQQKDVQLILDVLQEWISDNPDKLTNFVFKTLIPVIYSTDLHEHLRMKLAEIAIELKVNVMAMEPQERSGFLQDLFKKYIDVINQQQQGAYESWHVLWIFLVRVCHKSIHNKTDLMNGLLRIVEHAFRNQAPTQRILGYECWMELIDNSSLDMDRMCGPKQIRLLITPLKGRFSKQEIVIEKRFHVFLHLLHRLSDKATLCLTEFLEFCFGPVGNNEDVNKTGQGKTVASIRQSSIEALLEIMGHKCRSCVVPDVRRVFEKGLITKDNVGLYWNMIFKSVVAATMLFKDDECDLQKNCKIIKCMWMALYELYSFLDDCQEANKDVTQIINNYIEQTVDDVFYEQVLLTIFAALSKEPDGIVQKMLEPLLKQLVVARPHESNDETLLKLLNALAEILQSTQRQNALKVIFTQFEVSLRWECVTNGCKFWMWLNGMLTKEDLIEGYVDFATWPISYFNKFPMDLQKILAIEWGEFYWKFDHSVEVRTEVMAILTEGLKDDPATFHNVLTLLNVVINETKFGDYDVNFQILLLDYFKILFAINWFSIHPLESLLEIFKLFWVLPKQSEMFRKETVNSLSKCIKRLIVIQDNYSFLRFVRDYINEVNSDEIRHLFTANLSHLICRKMARCRGVKQENLHALWTTLLPTSKSRHEYVYSIEKTKAWQYTAEDIEDFVAVNSHIPLEKEVRLTYSEVADAHFVDVEAKIKQLKDRDNFVTNENDAENVTFTVTEMPEITKKVSHDDQKQKRRIESELKKIQMNIVGATEYTSGLPSRRSLRHNSSQVESPVKPVRKRKRTRKTNEIYTSSEEDWNTFQEIISDEISTETIAAESPPKLTGKKRGRKSRKFKKETILKNLPKKPVEKNNEIDDLRSSPRRPNRKSVKDSPKKSEGEDKSEEINDVSSNSASKTRKRLLYSPSQECFDASDSEETQEKFSTVQSEEIINATEIDTLKCSARSSSRKATKDNPTKSSVEENDENIPKESPKNPSMLSGEEIINASDVDTFKCSPRSSSRKGTKDSPTKSFVVEESDENSQKISQKNPSMVSDEEIISETEGDTLKCSPRSKVTKDSPTKNPHLEARTKEILNRCTTRRKSRKYADSPIMKSFVDENNVPSEEKVQGNPEVLGIRNSSPRKKSYSPTEDFLEQRDKVSEVPSEDISTRISENTRPDIECEEIVKASEVDADITQYTKDSPKESFGGEICKTDEKSSIIHNLNVSSANSVETKDVSVESTTGNMELKSEDIIIGSEVIVSSSPKKKSRKNVKDSPIENNSGEILNPSLEDKKENSLKISPPVKDTIRKRKPRGVLENSRVNRMLQAVSQEKHSEDIIESSQEETLNSKRNKLVVLHDVVLMEKREEILPDTLTCSEEEQRSLASSPINGDTPTRTKELLNNTLDISPIHEEASTPIIHHYTETKRRPKMMSMSPSAARIKKLMSHCKKFNMNSSEVEEVLPDEDILIFSREVPSPLAQPKTSILKRKFADISEETPSPQAKRKRVNFSDPTTTSKKVFLLEAPSAIYPELIGCTSDVKNVIYEMSAEINQQDILDKLGENHIKTVEDLAKLTDLDIEMFNLEVKSLKQALHSFNIKKNNVISLVDILLSKVQESDSYLKYFVETIMSYEEFSKLFLGKLEVSTIQKILQESVDANGISKRELYEKLLIPLWNVNDAEPEVKRLKNDAAAAALNHLPCEEIVKTFEGIVEGMDSDKSKQVLVDMFRMISSKLSLSSLVDLHMEFLKTIPSAVRK